MDYEEGKVKIVDGIHKAWRLLHSNMEKVPRDRWGEAGVLNEWSIKDLLAHLHEWHNMLTNWIEIGEKGGTPEMPAPGYKWNQLKEVNNMIYEKYKDIDLEEIEKKLETSHQAFLKMVDKLPAEALYERGYFPWTGNSYFKSYVMPNSSGHYNWAKKHIRRWMKEQGIS